MTPLPIFVVHRAGDTERATLIKDGYSDLHFQFFDAVDGHDLDTLRPHAEMLPDHFWNKPYIKLGAFACFLSHRNLWKKIAEGDSAHVIIAEDDSLPVPDLFKRLPTKLGDLTFINDRLAAWTVGTIEPVNLLMARYISSGINPIDQFRAPGADAYILSRTAAAKLVEQSKKDKVICGVDWYLLAAAWDCQNVKHRDVKHISELKHVHKSLGSRKNLIEASILSKPLYQITKGVKSVLDHKATIPISELREKLS